jgi:hypothetical protein
MTEEDGQIRELRRIKSVSDLLCTGHSVKADELHRRAVILDVLLLVVSAWLVAIAFLDESAGRKFVPFDVSAQIWSGLLGFAAFVLSLIQLRVDWKGRADAHRRSCDLYADVKRDIGYLIANRDFTDENIRRALTKNDMAAAMSVPISEADFLRIKRAHKTKVEISKILDDRPFSSILLIRITLWLKDSLWASRSR